jgi:hypothetical protein
MFSKNRFDVCHKQTKQPPSLNKKMTIYHIIMNIHHITALEM